MDNISREMENIELPQSIASILVKIKEEIEQLDLSREQIDEHRFKRIVRLLKASAYSNGRDKVNILDLLLLNYCLLSEADSIAEINKVILNNLLIVEDSKLTELEMIYQDFYEEVSSHFRVEENIHFEEQTQEQLQTHKQNQEGRYIYKYGGYGDILTHAESQEEHPRNCYYKAIYESKNSILKNKSREEILAEKIREIKDLYQKAIENKELIKNEFSTHLWIDSEHFKDWKQKNYENIERLEELKESLEELATHIRQLAK